MINKVILVGRVSHKPQLKQNQDGTKQFTQFSMATNSGFGDRKTTDWHDIVAFGKTAEVCANYVEKGTLIAVQGRISYGKYEKDGKTFKTVKILADDVTLLSSKKDSQEQQQPESNPIEVNPNSQFAETEEFDAPF